MTRKDYIAIANAIASARRVQNAVQPRYVDVSNTAINQVVRSLCFIFKSDNPRFDPHKFEDACK